MLMWPDVLLWVVFCRALFALSVWTSGYPLASADLATTLLETLQHGDGHATINEWELREALDDCVEDVKSDALNHTHSTKLQQLLQLVADDKQRLGLFEDVEGAFLREGGRRDVRMREAAGILAANLAQAMDKPSIHTADPAVQEAFFRYSIRIFPEHPVATRSLGFKLEQTGQELKAMELYREALNRTSSERLDLRLLLASACSPLLDDDGQGDLRFSRVSGEIQRLKRSIQMSVTPHRNRPSPGRDLAYIPSFSWPYLGRNMRPLMEGLCWILAAMTAGLHDAIPGLHPQNGWENNTTSGTAADRLHQHSPEAENEAAVPRTTSRRDDRIVVGVVMERRGNTSPHRLIQGVLDGMDRSKFRLVAFSRDYVAEYPDAGQAVLRAAEEVVIFGWHPFVTGLADPFSDRKDIAMAKVDVLIYVALGNTLWSHLLALGRLAPVQLAFGHGHPVTSGSPGIDYFVSSELFETSASIEAREARRNADTWRDILKAAATTVTPAEATDVEASHVDGCVDGTSHSSLSDYSPSHPRGSLQRIRKQRITEGVKHDSAEDWRGGGGDGEQDYAEQLVMFDSLTASLPDVYSLANAPATMVATLAAVGASSSTSATAGSISDGDHFYHCIQHAKKFHPSFDRILRGVLQTDPAAKILLAAGSEVHLPRWERVLGSDLIQRLVFLPYLSHAEMVSVVAHCRVMLDTFPWGAGITAMEALMAGVPVVTLPARISILPLARGQLAELGVEDKLVASDVDDMVKKAVRVASDSAYRDSLSAAILSRTDRLSNPDSAVTEWERFLERAVRAASCPSKCQPEVFDDMHMCDPTGC